MTPCKDTSLISTHEMELKLLFCWQSVLCVVAETGCSCPCWIYSDDRLCSPTEPRLRQKAILGISHSPPGCHPSWPGMNKTYHIMQNDTSQSDITLCHMAYCGTEHRPQEVFCYGCKEAYLQPWVRHRKKVFQTIAQIFKCFQQCTFPPRPPTLITQHYLWIAVFSLKNF